MARLPGKTSTGLARRLYNTDALKKLNSSTDQLPACISCLLWPLAGGPLLGNSAIGWSGAAGHAYHRGGGSSTDEDKAAEASSTTTSSSAADQPGSSTSESSSSSSSSSSSGGGRKSKQRPTRQLRDLRQSVQQDWPHSSLAEQFSDRQEAQQLPERVARIAMRDPLGVLISAIGVPLGISVKINREQMLEQHQKHINDTRRALMDEFDLQPSAASSSAPVTDVAAAGADSDDADSPFGDTHSSAAEWAAESEEHYTSVPDTDMQRLRLEQHVQTLAMKRSSRQKAAQQAAAAAAAEAKADAPEETPTALQQQLETVRAIIQANADRWGTTQQSPAEIAQQIADSNRAAGGSGDGGGDGAGEGDEGDDDDNQPLTLSPEEEHYADPSAVAAELKAMDEIFEVLAKVPWLDDEDVEERELRGLAAVGLLGTLEEVGWTMRDKVLQLWAGERDEALLTAGLGPREASAIRSVLFHTQQLEQQYGKPPQESVDKALAAAGAGCGEAGGAQGGDSQ